MSHISHKSCFRNTNKCKPNKCLLSIYIMTWYICISSTHEKKELVPEPQNDKKRGKAMRRYLFIIVAVLFSIGLVACSGEEVEEKEVDNIELADQDNSDESEEEEVEAAAESEETEETEEDKKKIDEEVADTENVTASLISVEKIVDKDFDEERYEIKFEVENKIDDLIVIQAREVSSDGKMIDESMLMMSQEISGGKSADAVLTIESFDEDLPEIKDDLEMKLQIIDGESYMDIESIDVNIDF